MEFLDLTDATDAEREFACDILHRDPSTFGVEFPFDIVPYTPSRNNNDDDDVAQCSQRTTIDGADGVEHVEPSTHVDRGACNDGFAPDDGGDEAADTQPQQNHDDLPMHHDEHRDDESSMVLQSQCDERDNMPMEQALQQHLQPQCVDGQLQQDLQNHPIVSVPYTMANGTTIYSPVPQQPGRVMYPYHMPHLMSPMAPMMPSSPMNGGFSELEDGTMVRSQAPPQHYNHPNMVAAMQQSYPPQAFYPQSFPSPSHVFPTPYGNFSYGPQHFFYMQHPQMQQHPGQPSPYHMVGPQNGSNLPDLIAQATTNDMNGAPIDNSTDSDERQAADQYRNTNESAIVAKDEKSPKTIVRENGVGNQQHNTQKQQKGEMKNAKSGEQQQGPRPDKPSKPSRRSLKPLKAEALKAEAVINTNNTNADAEPQAPRTDRPPNSFKQRKNKKAFNKSAEAYKNENNTTNSKTDSNLVDRTNAAGSVNSNSSSVDTNEDSTHNSQLQAAQAANRSWASLFNHHNIHQ